MAKRVEPVGRFLVCPNCSSKACWVHKPIVHWWLPDGGVPEPRPAGATCYCLECHGFWDATEGGARKTKQAEHKTSAREKPAPRDSDLKWRD